MATLAQLVTQRATAGARYTAAVAEMRASLVDLAALDRALSNGNVNPGVAPASTFSETPDSLPWVFCHPIYAPRQVIPTWRDQITSAADGYIASVLRA